MPTTSTRVRTLIRYALAGLLGLLAMNAFGGGLYGLAGARGVPTEWLRGSPFSSYFVPSLVLFAGVGGSLLLATIAVLRTWPTARALALCAGAVVLVWIAVQVAIIGYVSWLQPAVADAALAILMLTAMLPRSTAP